MSSYTQDDRQMEVTTPLGDDVLLLTGFKGGEQFNKLFHYELKMLSLNSAIAAKDIIGKNITFSVTLRDKAPRYFNGYVARFAFRGSDDRFSSYVAEIVPWTWFLTQTKDCRIFQDRTVPQIINEVLKDFQIADVDTSAIVGKHEIWNYCVQYRESDFDFLARLMEQEGIYYFFRHTNGKHTMVFGDTTLGYDVAEEKSASLAGSFATSLSADNIMDWERVYEFRPAKFAHTDYNFETPSANMVASASAKSAVTHTDQYEIFDYPGDFENKTQGEADARLRTEEIACGTDVVHGKSVNASWGPGYIFTVDQHYIQAEEGQDYVLTGVTHQATLSGEYRSTGHGDLEYSNTFTAIAATKVFRPDRVTPKPIVRGPQTAVVVGPPGETIPVDKYGRVKVSFFWDRRSKKDDTSSCWIRVSQISGGAGWGTMHHPHTGHEVIVSFIEGDPDRPIITGRVYNAENGTALDAVAKKTQSGIHDHGGNHIIMEGEGGNQRIKMHSPHSDTTFQIGSPNFDSDGFGGHTAGLFKFIIGKDATWDIGKNEKKEIHGFKDSKIYGYKTDLIFGWESKVVKGFSTSLIGGVKFEKVTGLDTKINLIGKIELLKAWTLKIHSGRLFESTPSKEGVFKEQKRIMAEDKTKAKEQVNLIGTLKEKLGEVQQDMGDVKQNMGDFKQKMKDLNQTIAKFQAKIADLDWTIERQASMIADKWKMESKTSLHLTAGSTIFVKASSMTVNADLAVWGGLFTAKK